MMLAFKNSPVPGVHRCEAIMSTLQGQSYFSERWIARDRSGRNCRDEKNQVVTSSSTCRSEQNVVSLLLKDEARVLAKRSNAAITALFGSFLVLTFIATIQVLLKQSATGSIRARES